MPPALSRGSALLALCAYAALIACYIGVLRYMAEKPSDTYDPAPTGGAAVLGGAQLARKAGEA